MTIRAQTALTLTLKVERFAYRQPFRISGHVFTETPVLVAEIGNGRHTGRGEGAGVYYLGDDIDHMLAEAERARPAIETGITREGLQSLMTAGGARNAIDCALWDLEAKTTGRPAWQAAGLGPPRVLKTTLTLGADTPDAMAKAAMELDPYAPVKVKLTGDLHDDVARLQKIRAARPRAWIGVDANQGYRRDTLERLQPMLVDCDIAMLEQPLPRGEEAELDGLKRRLPFVADESAVTLADVPSLASRFDVVNIKLDKCGGLTEGLAIAEEARRLGLGVMVGNMMGTSLSMAPSFLLGQLCDIIDLDGPTFLAKDRDPGVIYHLGTIACPPSIWG
jgi:L-Ala-D/L-Glu epimerase